MRVLYAIIVCCVLTGCIAPIQEPLATAVDDSITESELLIDSSETLWVAVGETGWRIVETWNGGSTFEGLNERWPDNVAETTGSIIAVRMEVENRGSVPVEFQAPNLVDDQGREFAAYSAYIYYVHDDDWCIGPLNPNVPRTCAVIYEVAADAEELAVVLHDLHDSKVEREPLSLGF